MERKMTEEMDVFDTYLNKVDYAVKENANTGFSLSGLSNYISEQYTKNLWLNKFYNKEIRESHVDGDIHIHDLGILANYCCGWDLSDLVLNGLCGVKDKTESKPAKRLESILGQMYNFIFTLQGENAGAQAFSNVDTLLAPFIRYNNMSYNQVREAIQGFVHNLNVATRVGFQVPFSNITLDLKCPNHLKNNPVVFAGEIQDDKYGEFQKEMDLFNKAFFEIMLKGDGTGKIFSFPVLTINVDKNFDWQNSVLDNLWEITKKYGTPNFANYIKSGMNIEDTRSLCCRLKIDMKDIQRGGMFASIPLVGGIGVVTINMPRIGYLSSDEKELFKLIEEKMNLAKDSLEIKRKVIDYFYEVGLYPYSAYYLRGIKEKTGKYTTNNFSIIAPVGVNELCINFIGKDISTPEGKELGLKILKFMEDKIEDFSRETSNNYSLEQSPAEGASGSLKRKDLEKYPEMKHINQKIAYTNSTHLPVNNSLNCLDMLRHQSDFNKYYTGGSVVHLYNEEDLTKEEVRDFIKLVMENFEVPYFSHTPTFSVCLTHGYLFGKQEICPECEEKTLIYSKVVGYHRPVNSWGEHKREEFKNRKIYGVAK